MKIAMAVLGSRGDIQPMALLGSELAARGHEVSLSTPPDLTDFGEALGLATFPMGQPAQDFLRSSEGQRWLSHATDRREYMAGLLAYKRASANSLISVLSSQVRGADIVVSGLSTELEAACMAEAQNIPLACVHHSPVRPNRSYPSPLFHQYRYPSPVNLYTHWLADQTERRFGSGYMAEVRRRIGLPEFTGSPSEIVSRMSALDIQAYSQQLVGRLHHWGDNRPFAGFIRPSREQQTFLSTTEDNTNFLSWLDADEPPAYFGFGSMPVQDLPALLRLVNEVSKRLGIRALVGAGWSATEDPWESLVDPARIQVVGRINHEAVLPRCQFAVHHGGAGTTEVSIRSGLPTIICPVAFDQPFWGRRLEQLKVGRMIPLSELAIDNLLRAIRKVNTPEAHSRVLRLAKSLSSEDGRSAAADHLETLV
ncbi:glycosyltransferase [Kitasatospora sp. NPDC101176]|uniref:glycosyltransferase n=1 Tax=Kitasatospora sp. NPDC101176 TaxID=3364099 RepID=UPI0038216CAF